MGERRFPIMRGTIRTIPWSIAEVAYREYVRRFGDSQTLERIAERGGFYISELDMLYPGWREALEKTKHDEETDCLRISKLAQERQRREQAEDERDRANRDCAVVSDRLATIERRVREVCDHDLQRPWELTSQDIGAVRDKLRALIDGT